MDKFINPSKPAEIEIEKDEPVVVSCGQNTNQGIRIGEEIKLNIFDAARAQIPNLLAISAISQCEACELLGALFQPDVRIGRVDLKISQK